MNDKAIQDLWSEEWAHCFGCGRENKKGLRIKSYWKGEESECEWHPAPHHQAFPGITCGGIIATIIDCHCLNTAVSYAYKLEGRDVRSDPPIKYVTGSLFIKYLNPTPINKPVTLRARVKEMVGKKIVVVCSLYSEDKKCAFCELVAIKLTPLD